MIGVSAPKRRLGGPKTKTGCQTCKIRRVKCDETKPSCHRCSSTGRTCDGYPSKTLLLSPSHHQTSTLIQRLTLHVPGSAQEKRSFQYFVTKTAAELTGYYTSSFWEHLILQASAAEPSLKHAVIAIGSLHEDFSCRAAGRKGAIVGISGAGQFAMNQYAKAISHLRRSLSTGRQAPLTALMSCILFVCFDSLRAFFDSAMVHLQSGLKILRDLRSASGNGVYYVLEQNIEPLFIRLSIMAVMHIDTRDTVDRRQFATDLDEIGGKGLQDKFESLEDARNAMNSVVGGLFRMFYIWDGDQPMNLQPPETYTMSAKYSAQLSQWSTTFNAFVFNYSSTLTPHQIRGAALLKIHHTTAQIMMSATPSVSDPITLGVAMNQAETFSNFVSMFEIIVNLSQSLVVAVEQDIKLGKPSLTFSTDLGLVGPLYYICVKCTSKRIREQAFELLGRCPRREGMWDSKVGICIIQEFWKIEERNKALQCSMENYFGEGVSVSLRDTVDLKLVDELELKWVRKGEEYMNRAVSEVGADEISWIGLLE